MAGPIPARIMRIQRTALILVVFAGTLNYVDRATLAIGNALIRHDLHLSIAEMGVLLSAFLWAYAFAQLPGGVLIDRYGPRKLLTAGLFIWSLAQVAGGLVGSFSQFVVARVCLECAGGEGLVERAGPGVADGHLQLHLDAGADDRPAAADGADAELQLALDVHHHGRGGHPARRDLGRDLSRAL
jgi:MFS family permease